MNTQNGLVLFSEFDAQDMLSKGPLFAERVEGWCKFLQITEPFDQSQVKSEEFDRKNIDDKVFPQNRLSVNFPQINNLYQVEIEYSGPKHHMLPTDSPEEEPLIDLFENVYWAASKRFNDLGIPCKHAYSMPGVGIYFYILTDDLNPTEEIFNTTLQNPNGKSTRIYLGHKYKQSKIDLN